MSEKADLHPNYIGRVERGEEHVSLIALRRIAKALGVRGPGSRLEHLRVFAPDARLWVALSEKVLGVNAGELLPKNLPFKQLGSQFQSGNQLVVFPARGE